MENNHSNNIVEKYLGKTRRIVMGAIFLAIALLVYFVFAKGNSADSLTTFNMTPGGSSSSSYPDWVFPTNSYLSFLAGVCLILGRLPVGTWLW